MAEQPVLEQTCKQAEQQRKEALKKLNDQLLCPVCLEDYTDPNLLICLHVFCKKCLERLVVKDAGKRIIRCPTCRGVTTLTQDNLSQLQSAFYIHHLFEVRDVLQRVSTTDETKCDKCGEGEAKAYCRDCRGFVCQACITVHKKWKEYSDHEIASLEDIEKQAVKLVPQNNVVLACSKHPTENLKIFCETCDQLICRDCTIADHTRPSHQYYLVNDCFQKHKDAIVRSLVPTKLYLGIASGAIAEVKSRSNRLETRGEHTKERIRGTIDHLCNLLEASKIELTSRIDEVVKLTCKSLDTQCEEFELTQTQLSSCAEFVEESLRTGTHEEVLSLKKQVVERAEQITREFDPSRFQLKPEVNLYFEHVDLASACEAFGKLCLTPLCIPRCYAIGPGLKEATVKTETKFSVYTVAEGDEACIDPHAVITGELVSEKSGSIVNCKVSKKEQNRYELRYQPLIKGKFQLHVKINGFHIEDSPFQVAHVTVVTELNSPWHLAYSDRLGIVVSENRAHCVSVFDREGKKLFSFGNQGSDKKKVFEPRGIAVLNDDSVLVTANHCVKKFGMDGTFIASVGLQGAGKLQFDCPSEVAINEKSKKIYVCDTNNHRIQIFNLELAYCGSFGSRGSHQHQFANPTDIAIDSHQKVFVADCWNERIQVYNSEGIFQYRIQERGTGMELLHFPIGVCIDRDDNVYVLENEKCRVSIFRNDGSFLKSFGEQGNEAGQFKAPVGIAVDRSGCVYIADTGNKRIQIFEHMEGELLTVC